MLSRPGVPGGNCAPPQGGRGSLVGSDLFRAGRACKQPREGQRDRSHIRADAVRVPYTFSQIPGHEADAAESEEQRGKASSPKNRVMTVSSTPAHLQMSTSLSMQTMSELSQNLPATPGDQKREGCDGRSKPGTMCDLAVYVLRSDARGNALGVPPAMEELYQGATGAQRQMEARECVNERSHHKTKSIILNLLACTEKAVFGELSSRYNRSLTVWNI